MLRYLPIHLKKRISMLRVSSHGWRRHPRVAFHGIVQRLLRRRDGWGGKQAYLLQKDDIGIRLAAMHGGVDEVDMLVTRMYTQRGYDAPARRPDPGGTGSLRRVTLEACHNHRTVGTITVNLDSAEGLHAEDLYRDEIAPFRQRGAQLCEFTRLALDIENCGKCALACLFHIGFIFAFRIHHATDLFIEVNPRHEAFYRRKLGFKVIGSEKLCARVNAPAVLLHKDLLVMSEELIRFGGLSLPWNRSFYAFGLPPWEETELFEEIKKILAPTH